MADRLVQRLEDFGRALDRLDEALAVSPKADLALDGTIQRFEFAFELAWKALKDALLLEGLDVRTPRESLREAYGAGWLDSEETWLGMLSDRNLSSHVHNEALAAEIYGRVRTYAPVLRRLHELIHDRFDSDIDER